MACTPPTTKNRFSAARLYAAPKIINVRWAAAGEKAPPAQDVPEQPFSAWPSRRHGINRLEQR